MAYIRVDQAMPVFDGQPVTFKSPASCKGIEGLKVYYPVGKGTAVATFALADAHGNNVGSIDLFAANVLVKVILDTDQGMAYVQNADTNAYLEGRLAKIEGGAVKKSGDTMTGNLTISRTGGVALLLDEKTNGNTGQYVIQSGGAALLSATLGGLLRGISFRNSGDTALDFRYHDGNNSYPILHAGNSNRSKLVNDDSLPDTDGEIFWRYK